jgi:hypothetical protein
VASETATVLATAAAAAAAVETTNYTVRLI